MSTEPVHKPVDGTPSRLAPIVPLAREPAPTIVIDPPVTDQLAQGNVLPYGNIAMAHVEPLKLLTLVDEPGPNWKQASPIAEANLSSVTGKPPLTACLCGYGDNRSASGLLVSAYQTGRTY